MYKYNFKYNLGYPQILLLILNEFKRINELFPPEIIRKTKGFLMLSGGIEVDLFA